jgi:hypothetical protein
MKKLIALVLVLVFVCVSVGCADTTSEDITGAIKFYSEATLEKTSPVSATSVELSKDQIKGIKKILKNVEEWEDDSMVDRMEYYFDGEFKLSDCEFVYYFSYECNIIFYSHYAGKITAEEMQFIKSIGV